MLNVARSAKKRTINRQFKDPKESIFRDVVYIDVSDLPYEQVVGTRPQEASNLARTKAQQMQTGKKKLR